MDLLTISYSGTVSDVTTHSLEISFMAGMAKWAKGYAPCNVYVLS